MEVITTEFPKLLAIILNYYCPTEVEMEYPLPFKLDTQSLKGTC